jgi:hypothetical protein
MEKEVSNETKKIKDRSSRPRQTKEDLRNREEFSSARKKYTLFEDL